MPRKKQNRLIPEAPVGRLIMAAGGKRVSADAATALTEVLEDYAKDIGVRAVEISRHTGRKTILADDIKLAVKK